jgi:enamine deaminase RidA (YjgF/YER057c/UK114 family)
MSRAEQRLEALGLILPPARPPVANYVGTKRSGALLFVSGRVTRQPEVVDGASDPLVALFGEAGRHARTATGAAQLPFGAAVQLDLVLRLSS